MSNSDDLHVDTWLMMHVWRWFNTYPAAPLPIEAFSAFLNNRSVVFSVRDIFELCDETSPWRKEYEYLIKIGQLKTQSERAPGPLLRFGYVKNQAEREHVMWNDLFDLDYCLRTGKRYLTSTFGIPRLPKLTEVANEYAGGAEDWPIDTQQRLRTVMSWVFDVEVPELRIRSERISKERQAERAVELDRIRRDYELYESANGNPRTFEDYVAFRLVEDWAAVYISPGELVDLIDQSKEVAALREVLHSLAVAPASQAETNGLLKRMWDERAGRLKIAGYTFDSIGVLLLALGLPGAITKPVQYIVNNKLSTRPDWLIALNSFNRKLRDKHDAA